MLTKKPHVVYWNNIPAPYMVDRFNAVAYRGNLDFEAWFNARREPDRSWTVNESQWDFNCRYLPLLPIGVSCIRIVLPLLERRTPDLLVSLYAEPVFVIGWAIVRARGVRTMFRALMTFDRLKKGMQDKDFGTSPLYAITNNFWRMNERVKEKCSIAFELV